MINCSGVCIYFVPRKFRHAGCKKSGHAGEWFQKGMPWEHGKALTIKKY